MTPTKAHHEQAKREIRQILMDMPYLELGDWPGLKHLPRYARLLHDSLISERAKNIALSEENEKLRSGVSDEAHYWSMVDWLGWGRDTTDYRRTRELISKYPIQEQLALGEFVRQKRKALVEALNVYADKHGNRKTYYGLSDDGLWDLTAHIVGEGENKWLAVMNNPEIAKEMADKGQFTENFQYTFSHIQQTSAHKARLLELVREAIEMLRWYDPDPLRATLKELKEEIEKIKSCEKIFQWRLQV